VIALSPDVDVHALKERIHERNVRIQALTAEQARDLALLDELDGWRGDGRRDCVDWVSCELGWSLPNARALVAAGQAARELPELGDAFSAGDLSVDKMRLLAAGVVTPEDEGTWVQTARSSSPAELARRCREARNSQRTGPERDRAQRAQRHLHAWYDEENMFRISGALPSYEGAIVQIALHRFEERLRDANRIDLDPPADPGGARKADALVWICDAVLAESGATDTPCAPPAQIIVHAGYDVLTGANPNGRCHVEDGPALSAARLRQLGCDATVKTLIERDGVAIADGRQKPTVPPRMKRAVRSRDGVCGYPGCAVPATRCEAHHIDHWFDGGPTELWNILSQCSHHHDAHHRGEFDIYRTLAGDLKFVNPDGEVFGTLTAGQWKRPRTKPGPDEAAVRARPTEQPPILRSAPVSRRRPRSRPGCGSAASPAPTAHRS